MRFDTVIIDPGHGGIDKNGNYTTAPSKMFEHKNGETAYEGVLNRQIAEALFWYLSCESDLNVVFTVNPADPTDISLQDRVDFANLFNPDTTVFISIHCNASPEQTGTGCEIFTTTSTTFSDDIAINLRKSLTPLLNIKRKRFRGIRAKNFKVLRDTKCPAVLVECLFFDNFDDYKYLKDSNTQLAFGQAMCEGILNTLKTFENESL